MASEERLGRGFPAITTLACTTRQLSVSRDRSTCLRQGRYVFN